MKPVVLKLSDPKVASIYSDFPLMQRWEMLRRSEEPLTPAQLAQVCRTSVATVQHGLDQLQAAGLVVRLKSSARSRQIKYRVVSTSLIFEYDEQSEEQRRRVADQREALKQYGRRCIDRAHTTRLPAEQFLGYWTTDITTILTKAEAREIRDVMIGAGRAIGAIEHRARARLKSEAAKSSEPPLRRRSAGTSASSSSSWSSPSFPSRRSPPRTPAAPSSSMPSLRRGPMGS